MRIHFNVRSKVLLLATAILIGCAATPAKAQTAFGLPSPTAFRNSSWAFGEIFTVGPANIVVTALGALDTGGDGFVTPGGIPVGIFLESNGTLLTSTFVTSADPLTDNFRFANIAPLVLSAGVQYRVVAVNRDDTYNTDLNFTVNPFITRNGYGYGETTELSVLNNFTGSERIWMSNFRADSFPPNAAPEPGTLALGFTGILAFAGMTIRRRRS